MLLTVEEAQQHLRIDSEDDASYIEELCKAASAMIKAYLNGGETHAGEEVKPDIKAAARLLVGDFYRHRESSKNLIEFGADKMPVYVSALLHPHREGLGI